MVPAKKSAPGSRREASTELMAGSLGDGFAPCDWDILYIYIYISCDNLYYGL